MLGWYLSELSALLTIPKLSINWPELEESLEEGHYSQQVAAGQEETEERTVEEAHLEGEEVYGVGAGTKEGVAQAQKLALLVATVLEFSVIFRCGVVRGLYFWRNKFRDIIPSNKNHPRHDKVSLSFLSIIIFKLTNDGIELTIQISIGT